MGWALSCAPWAAPSLLMLCLSPPGGMSPSALAALLLTGCLEIDEIKLNLKQTPTLVLYQGKKKNISNWCVNSPGWRQGRERRQGLEAEEIKVLQKVACIKRIDFPPLNAKRWEREQDVNGGVRLTALQTWWWWGQEQSGWKQWAQGQSWVSMAGCCAGGGSELLLHLGGWGEWKEGEGEEQGMSNICAFVQGWFFFSMPGSCDCRGESDNVTHGA